MAYAESNPKQHAHELIELMAPGQVSAVVGLLEVMLNPLAHTLANAPIDDEPVAGHEAREITASRAPLARGEGTPHEVVLAEFGLSSEDFEQLGRTPLEDPGPGQ